jgi:uncharacterized protein
MTRIVSDVIRRNDHPPIAVDFHFPEKGDVPVPVIVFLHGFKGFKDWGHFPLVAEYLARSGFVVVRFNFSHNGTTPEHPAEFADLEAFGRNTFTQEMKDLGIVLEEISWRGGKELNCDPSRVGLLGHSRGGGIALLAARHDKRVKAVATWAGVSDFEPRVNAYDVETWKKDGVIYQLNTRTGQQMPLYYSLREDFYANKKLLDIPAAVKRMPVPQLIVQGTADDAVLLREAEQMNAWNLLARLEVIEGANHGFGGKHPWESKELPEDTIKALQPTITFFRETL